MNELPPLSTVPRPPSTQLRVDELCRRFQAAWEAGQQPRIETYLEETSAPERAAVLKELLALEVARRSRVGEQPSADEYLERFPDYADLVAACFAEATRALGPHGPDLRTRAEASTWPGGSPEGTASLPAVPGHDLLGVLGRGGMGVVYLARQRNLNRKVALKVLPPALAADPERLRRFRNEAEVAARLHDCRLVTVLDVLDLDGVPVLVLPYIEGADLGRILADRQAVRRGAPPAGRHPWAALDDRAYLKVLLPVLDMVLESVAALHQAAVLHRDIKPSNVLVDQRHNAWLSDFGLARLGEQSVLTAPGLGMGTRGFMSPEQWEGRDDLDYRADVFSLGATLYQALTLELPYGTARVEDRSPRPKTPSRLQPLLSADFDAVLLKALEPERAPRYASVEDLRGDWQRVRQGLYPRARRPGRVLRLARRVRRQPVAAAALGLIVVLLALLVGRRAGPGAASPGAVTPAPETAPTAAADSGLSRTVRIVTEPPGARVVLVPLDDQGELRPDRAVRPQALTPLTVPHVQAGAYLVVADLPGHGFHEVYRTVPRRDQIGEARGLHQMWDDIEGGGVRLPAVVIPTADVLRGMARFPGGTFTMGGAGVPGAPPHPRDVAAFYLDPTEVTVGAFRKVRKGLPAPGAAGQPPDSYPVASVTFDAALAYAEETGKRLPDEAEYEFAATGGGKSRFPWGDDAQRLRTWPLGPAGEPAFDRTPTDPPVYGLFSNVAEWTTSWHVPDPGTLPAQARAAASPEMLARFSGSRIVRGGPSPVVRGSPDPVGRDRKAVWDPRYRNSLSRDAAFPGLGFRCARSAGPRFLDR